MLLCLLASRDSSHIWSHSTTASKKRRAYQASFLPLSLSLCLSLSGHFQDPGTWGLSSDANLIMPMRIISGVVVRVHGELRGYIMIFSTPFPGIVAASCDEPPRFHD
ncbi:hypothetical protein LY76DRAFT_411012 [Colletotrichum caudatum]|nr:hypothetical protein LY76DRAFT_411012 [Colletotrichum caudatum]